MDLVEGFGELLGAYIQPESCFDLLQGSCLTYIPLGTSLVTYIRQGGILLLNLFSFMTYTHLRDLLMYMASLVMYIHQGGILLLSLFLFFCDLHPFKGFCHVYGFISNVHPLRRNLVTQPFSFGRLDLFAQRLGLNNFFINFRNEYIYLLCLLVVLLQLLNVPWTWEPLSV